jgi:putative addiction module component (TIGR02574 family)
MSVAEVLEKVRELKPEERNLVLAVLEQEFSDDTVELSDAWKAEIERRLKAYESGEMKSYSREEAFARARKAIE